MKTKERLAEEYANRQFYPDIHYQNIPNFHCIDLASSFLAGYDAAQRWIPISEEPIPLSTPVICCNERSSRHEYFIHQKHYNEIMAIRYYTHWLPIPKLPTA